MNYLNRPRRDHGTGLRRFVKTLIGVVVVLQVCFFVGVIALAIKAIAVADSQDWSGGVKPVIEKLWCGKPGCLG